MKRAVVVIEATSGIGSGLVQAALNERRPVIAVSDDAARLALLKAAHPGADLVLMEGSIVSETESATLAERLRALDRPIAGILISRCNEQPRGRVLDQSVDALKRQLDEDLLPQLAAARCLLPLLAESGHKGSYVVISGPGSENPWAGYGHRSVCAAALNMLVRVLHNEARALAVRVQLLAVDTPVRTKENAGMACEQWPSELAIGTRALELLASAATTEPVQAVVRYTLPTPRVIATSPEASERSPARAHPPAPASTSAFDDKSPQHALDDTWALLKPFLTTTRNEVSRK